MNLIVRAAQLTFCSLFLLVCFSAFSQKNGLSNLLLTPGSATKQRATSDSDTYLKRNQKEWRNHRGEKSTWQPRLLVNASQLDDGKSKRNDSLANSPTASFNATNASEFNVRESNPWECEPRFTFAIFAYNFGNYRGEMEGLQKLLPQFKSFGLDSFFFTDGDLNHIKGWTIVHIPKEADQNFSYGIYPGGRINIKRIKFLGHEVLKPYRFLIHMDTDRKKMASTKHVIASFAAFGG